MLGSPPLNRNPNIPYPCSVLNRLTTFFADPARQALGWSGLGILGLGLAAIGLVLFNSGGSVPPAAVVSSPTSGPSATPMSTPTPSPTAPPTTAPSPSPSPTPTTALRASSAGQDSAGTEAPAAPTATPTPAEPTDTPTPPAVVAGGPYCPSISQATPPNTVIGRFTVGGQPAPLGTQVTLAFDGVPGPTGNSGTAAGGYHIDYGAAGSGCANRVGAVITVIYNGVAYPTGHTIGDNPGSPVIANIAAP